jgi:hypothetical protein
MAFALEFDNTVGEAFYSRTMAYLRRSPTAMILIDSLAGRPEVILVRVTSSEEYKNIFRSRWIPPTALSGTESSQYSGGILNWCVYDWTMVKSSRKFQTPAIALMHEMGHAYQYLCTDQKNHFNAVVRGDFLARWRWISKLENENVMLYETRVAEQLKEGTRAHYEDNIRMEQKECLARGLQFSAG